MLAVPCDGEDQSEVSLWIEKIDGSELLRLPLMKGERFYLQYIHSSDQTPVLDTFQIGLEGQLVLIEEAFRWYGAGLEFRDYRDSRIIFDGKWSRVRLNRIFPELVIRVGRVAQQRFIYRDRSIPLDRLAKPGERLVLSVSR